MDRLDTGSGAQHRAELIQPSQGIDAHEDLAILSQRAAVWQQAPLKDTGAQQYVIAASAKDLENQNKLGKLSIVDIAAQVKENDSAEKDSDHLDVGSQLSWSRKERKSARPQDGQGYYDVMKSVGQDLLGRPVNAAEVQILISGARALQEYRGRDPKELNSHDELLPKNEKELSIFLNGLIAKPDGKIEQRDVQELQRSVFEALQQHAGKITGDKIVLDLRPVKDQKEVTDKVPTAVYIDSSNIEGGQGYRRTTKCEPETQNYWLSKATADALMKVQAALIADHKDPLQLRNMNGAGRRAIDRELISKCAPDQPHAKKHSQHEDGISIDVDNYDDPNVRAALTKQGFVHNVPGDKPHFTYLPKSRK